MLKVKRRKLGQSAIERCCESCDKNEGFTNYFYVVTAAVNKDIRFNSNRKLNSKF